jgi:hypothetical protein
MVGRSNPRDGTLDKRLNVSIGFGIGHLGFQVRHWVVPI